MQIRLLDGAAAQEIYETRMVQDFPAAELKPFSAVREMMQAGIYEPLVLEDEAGVLQAYAWQVLLPGRRSALLDYFAVRSDLRGGGIGTRGPGETKLESDRRHIRERINRLEEELEQVRKVRSVQRERRMKNSVPVVAIVGYTNAGKSTLLNYLTDAGILAQDMLFATLDPTTRTLELPSGQKILLTDTVGFIRKLPHHLIEAFKSTLEEARYSDIILHVVDVSNPQMETQIHIVYETLRQLEITDKTVITVFNKMDRLTGDVILRDFRSDFQVKISAKTGEGIPALLETLEGILRSRKVYLEKVFPYAQAGKIQSIRRYGELLSEEYTEEGIAVKAYVPAEIYGSILQG